MFDNLYQISFAHKWVLWLIPIVLLLAVAWYWWLAKRNYPALKVSSSFAFKGFENPIAARIKQLLPVLRVLALVLLLVALARPQTNYDESEITTEGIDIVLAMDVSPSMLAKDFMPDRLEAAKREALEFIDKRPHDRIGLVVFAGESFTQCPVTIDHNIVKTQLKNISSNMLQEGTAIGMGLGTAVQRLKESAAKSKVVVLMTDGVNNAGSIEPLTAADIALNYEVRVYTIGIGTNGKALVPIAMYSNGEIMYDYMDVEIDEALLKDIAKKTGGEYFRATGNKGLKEIYAQIDKLERTKIEVSAYQRKAEKFHAFALGAILLLAVELLFRYLIVRSIP